VLLLRAEPHVLHHRPREPLGERGQQLRVVAQAHRYYGSETLAKRLHLSAAELVAARAQLVELDLLAYQAPLYQVLSLGSAPRVLSGNAGNAGARASGGGLVSLAEIIERASRHA